jgi:hypothetical protein
MKNTVKGLSAGVFLLLILSLGSWPFLNVARSAVPRDWVMHIYVGGHLYEDRLHLEQSGVNAWTGTIAVPGLFTVPVTHVVLTKSGISFDIEADEGKGPFHVKYVGTFYPGTETFSGFATLIDKNTLLGGFVGQRN